MSRLENGFGDCTCEQPGRQFLAAWSSTVHTPTHALAGLLRLTARCPPACSPVCQSLHMSVGRAPHWLASRLGVYRQGRALLWVAFLLRRAI